MFCVLATSFVFSACSSDDDFEHEDNFKKSRNAWTDFKKQSNNSYKYVVVGSTWIGYSWETGITVKDGKVVERDFKTFKDGKEEGSWIELEAELNNHVETPAAATITLDEVYQKAQTDWLKTRKNTETFFETKNNGMISTCGYTENGCADDCFRGIYIKSIEVLK